MFSARFFPGCSAVGLLLAACLLIPVRIAAQTTQATADTSATLPPEVQAKLDRLQADLKAAQAKGDAKTQARLLNEVGKVYWDTSQGDMALNVYNQALTLARFANDAQQEAAALNGIAGCYLDDDQNDTALGLLHQALDLATSSGDLVGQATALKGIGWADDNTHQPQQALQSYQKALALTQQAGDLDLEATILWHVAGTCLSLSEPQKALDNLNQALPIFRQVDDHPGEDMTLTSLGSVSFGLGELQKALDYYNQALPVLREVGDHSNEGMTLFALGNISSSLGRNEKALEYLNQALSVVRQLGDQLDEAKTLNRIGFVYSDLGEQQKAIDYYNQALPIARQSSDLADLGAALRGIAYANSLLRDPRKALDYYDQALAAFRAADDRDGESLTLNGIGLVYSDLGEPHEALDHFNQALTIFLGLGELDYEAFTLGNIGMVYSDLGEPQKALDSLNQALSIFRQVSDRGSEGKALAGIGIAYSSLGDKQKALDYYNQALPILREAGDRSGEATALANIGLLYFSMGDKQKALDDYNQALPLATAVSDPLLEAFVLGCMASNQSSGHPAEAIFYGKQGVNLLQQIRGNIQGLDKELQSSFLASHIDYYRDLADLLIAQNRLPEAEQVLDLLKQQEYSDYTRGAAADMLSPLTLTPAEQQAEADYQQSTAQLIQLGEDWKKLKKNQARTPDQEAQFQDLNTKLKDAGIGLTAYYSRLHVLFANVSDLNDKVNEIQGHVSGLQDAVADSPRTVALYTMVTKDHYRVIVTSSKQQTVAREYAISDTDLSRKVAAFDQVLRDPGSDPRPLAQELYNILIGPVKADLDQANAETLVWSLDGVLRYVPLAALYDGKQYLVENYSTVTIAPESYTRLPGKPDVSGLSVVGMGISRQYEDNLPALPAVVGELDGVVRDAHVQGANGVLPGTILLNGQFTEKAMENALNGQYSVVHIASHFVFQPGDDSKSYLLLADDNNPSLGHPLTVEEFGNNPSLDLTSTDLLTLSACQTGISGDTSDGREVDGLGITAQKKGAKAVISSLWSVNDASTGQLMADFYKLWAGGGGKVMKVEALRQAQLDMLHGKINGNGSASGRGFEVVENATPVPAGFSHPYYWAPFVLMGNWK